VGGVRQWRAARLARSALSLTLSRRRERGPDLFAVALIAVAVAVAGCSAGNVDAVELAPGALFEGLIAHWSFDDTGTTLTDSTANHYDGMVLAGTAWLPGEHFGGALHFTGDQTDSEVDVPLFPKPTGSWSVAGWIRASAGDTTNGTYATIISTELPQTGGWQLNLRLSPGPANPTNPVSLYQYAYWVGPNVGDYDFTECKCFAPDEWVHIAGVVDTDRGTISVYRNGVFAGSKATTGTISNGSETLFFGRWANDDFRRLLGDLDDFVVYNRALTSPEIKLLASAPLPAMPPP
jgi:arabinan endo-1,5-alpha-L-arabinosidase